MPCAEKQLGAWSNAWTEVLVLGVVLGVVLGMVGSGGARTGVVKCGQSMVRRG